MRGQRAAHRVHSERSERGARSQRARRRLPRRAQRDAAAFPEKDGQGRKITYGTCTNAEGKASICPFDATKTSVQNIIALKAGYKVGSLGKTTYAADSVVNATITLEANPAATKEKILIMACERGNVRDPLTFARENIHYTVAPFAKVIDTLLQDSAKPLEYFDTLYIGKSCSSREAWGELLVPEKRERLHKWIEAGGLVFLAQQDDDLWSRGVNGCPDSATYCPMEFLPTELQFDIYPTKCNDFRSGTILEPTHPTMQAVDLNAWNYNSPSSPTTAEKKTSYNAIVRSTVKTDYWKILAVAPAAGAAGECADVATDQAVVAMEGTYGEGKIYVGEHGWETGSQGDISGGMTEAKAIVAKNRVIEYLKAQQK
jgi:hypothetical protein